MNFQLKNNDTVGLIACSNGINESNKEKIEALEKYLNSVGINVIYAKTLYNKFSIFSGTGEERANELMKLFIDKKIKAIFDVSGGDLANGILEYLDFEAIKKNPKPFFGYSDLSVLLNSLNELAEIETYHYQVRNLVGNFKEIQRQNFENTFIEGKDDILKLNYEIIQGDKLEGKVVGGNIRCLLKLAGTKYMPSFKDKILFLESLGGDVGKITTYLTQYKNIGVFKEVSGILLGTFSEMEKNKYEPSVEEILKEVLKDKKITIAKTKEIGHGENSKCLIIGRNLDLI